MRIKDILMIQGYVKQNKQRSIWRKLVRMMACIVVFCTTYALILPVITLERSYICQESKIALHRAMHSLPPQYRQVLWLIYFEDFTAKQAAMTLGKTVHNTHVLLYRARAALRAQLEKEGFVYENL